MNGLILVVIVIVVVVAVVYFWPRIRDLGANRGGASPTPLSPAPRHDDPDQVDEATQILHSIGGAVRAGDAATIQIADPEPWGIPSFELDLSIAAVTRADIRDATGLFSFMIYWMPPDQEAAVVTVEGDVPALSEVFVGRLVEDPALTNALVWCRDQYLADPVNNEREFDLDEYGLGTWTAFTARDGGTLALESGTAPLLPAGTAMGSGLPYRDCILFQGTRQAADRLRLVQIGTFAYVFRGEVGRLGAATFLRRTINGQQSTT